MKLQQLQLLVTEIPPGTYPALTGGYVAEFKVDGQVHRAQFQTGVRGFNIRDYVTVDDSMNIRSNVLGEHGVLC